MCSQDVFPHTCDDNEHGVDGLLSGQGTRGIADQAASALGDQSAGGTLDQAKGMLGGMFGQGD